MNPVEQLLSVLARMRFLHRHPLPGRPELRYVSTFFHFTKTIQKAPEVADPARNSKLVGLLVDQTTVQSVSEYWANKTKGKETHIFFKASSVDYIKRSKVANTKGKPFLSFFI